MSFYVGRALLGIIFHLESPMRGGEQRRTEWTQIGKLDKVSQASQMHPSEKASGPFLGAVIHRSGSHRKHKEKDKPEGVAPASVKKGKIKN